MAPNPAAVAAGKLRNVQYLMLETPGWNGIVVFPREGLWQEEWALYRDPNPDVKAKKRNDWLYDWNIGCDDIIKVQKAIRIDSRLGRIDYWKGRSPDAIAQIAACDKVGAEACVVNYCCSCPSLPYQVWRILAKLPDGTIVHPSVLMKENWEEEVQKLRTKRDQQSSLWILRMIKSIRFICNFWCFCKGWLQTTTRRYRQMWFCLFWCCCCGGCCGRKMPAIHFTRTDDEETYSGIFVDQEIQQNIIGNQTMDRNNLENERFTGQPSAEMFNPVIANHDDELL